MLDPLTAGDDDIKIAEEAVRVFEELGDQLGLARSWRALGIEERRRGRLEESARACERALEHARLAGDQREVSRSADGLCTALLYGPAEATAAIDRCREMLEQAGGNQLLEANILASLGELYAMREQFEEARAAARRSERIYLDLGLRIAFAGLTQVAGPIELLAGDPFAAEEVIRRGYDILHEIGATGESDALLAEALYRQGRYEEAAAVVAAGADRIPESDVPLRVLFLGLEGRLSARSGSEGKTAARSAVDLAATTDALNLHADALANLAETLRLGGRTDEAAAATEDAVRLYERKGNLAAGSRVQAATV